MHAGNGVIPPNLDLTDRFIPLSKDTKYNKQLGSTYISIG